MNIKDRYALGRNNKVWNAFILFLVWPVVNIVFSVTLYLFVFLWNKEGGLPAKRQGYIRSTERPFWILAIIFVLSTVFIPDTIHTSTLTRIQILIQHIYWIIVSIFIIRNRPKIDFDNLIRISFIGVVILTITFFFLENTPFRNTPIFSLRISRNGFIYTLLVFFPFFLAYVRKRYGKKFFNVLTLLAPILFLLTEGRAGAVLGILESLLIHLIYNPRILKVWGPIGVILGLTLMLMPYDMDDYRKNLSGVVRPFSERVAEFIAGSGDGGDLSHDRSWLVRQLMIEKGLEIYDRYPLFGVGPLNFTKYRANIMRFSRDLKYQRLAFRMRSNDSDLNTTSAHNAYIQMIAEYGLPGFMVIAFILLKSNIFFIKQVLTGRIREIDLPHISVLAISIHFFVISSFTGTSTFVILGLSQASLAWPKLQKWQLGQ